MENAPLETTEISPVKAMTLGMTIQGVTLALAVVCLYFSAIDVVWLGGSNAVSAVGLGIVGAVLSFLLCWWLTRSKTGVGATLRNHCQVLHPLFCNLSWGHIGLLATAAGVCEELLFRGFLQPWLASLTSPMVGILIASIVFGLLHYASFIYFFITFAIGVILGVAYWITESLLLVVVWHGVYDLIAIGVLARFPGWLNLDTSRSSNEEVQKTDR